MIIELLQAQFLLSLAVTNFLTTGKFILPITSHFHFSFCTVSRRDTQHQQNTALQAMQALSVTLCYR